jgi:4-diphosphocytidyl-2-C-methyl-D-erythritol kinase
VDSTVHKFEEDPSGTIRLDSDHPGLSTGPDNLVCRAAERLRQHTGCVRGAHVRLTKRIPLAAGLAGGSTDAAAALAGLNELWGLGLTPVELAALAARLGSDIPFFLGPGTAWCTGRGEMVAPLTPGRPLYLLLACPPAGLGTAEVYRGVVVPEAPGSGDEVRQAVEAGDVDEVGRRLHNRLQPVAEKLCPQIREVLEALAAHCPAGQLMSGSGSSVFALCRDQAEGLHILQALRRPSDEDGSGFRAAGGVRLFLVRSCS